MGAQSKKPLFEWKTGEIKAALRNDPQHVVHSYNGLMAELDRRQNKAVAAWSLGISLFSLAVSILALVFSAR